MNDNTSPQSTQQSVAYYVLLFALIYLGLSYVTNGIFSTWMKNTQDAIFYASMVRPGGSVIRHGIQIGLVIFSSLVTCFSFLLVQRKALASAESFRFSLGCCVVLVLRNLWLVLNAMQVEKKLPTYQLQNILNSIGGNLLSEILVAIIVTYLINKLLAAFAKGPRLNY